MWIALNKQAETYFQSISDVDKGHKESAESGELQKFYALLICKYLPSAQLTSKIVNFHTNKSIKWDIFIDAIWGFSLSLTEDNELFKALANFISEIDSKNIVERSYLMKSLPQNLIDTAGLQKKQTLEKKTNRAYTKFYYDQKKHNLLRENNQGYAKLCLLFATMNYSHSSETVWNKVLSLIGNFDLDPDRVLDLLIESYVQSANSQICLNLIKNFNPQSIVALIGNRILRDCSAQQSQKIIYVGKIENFLTGTPAQLYKQLQNSINPKLINLICRLVKQNTVKLQLALPYLNPTDAVFDRQQSKKLQSGRQKILKSFKLIMEEPTPDQIDKLKQQQNLKFSGQMLFSSKLALLNGFVCVNDWSNFIDMWKKYQNKLDLITYQPLLRSLLQMLQWIIDPLYSKISHAKFFKFRYESTKTSFMTTHNESQMVQQKQQPRRQMTQCKVLNETQFQKIIQLFDIIKIYIGFHSKIYIKICRLFLRIIKQPTIFDIQKPNQSMPVQNSYNFLKQKIQYIIKSYLLPAISLQTGNPSLPKQLYQLLQQFDYRFRYSCYLTHYSQTMTNNPYLANVFYKTRNRQIAIVNNMSDKNKKVYMKKMAKITHNQALQTFYWIFRRILMQDYQKVVPQIVSVLANCCAITLQMSIFIALHILNQQKQPAMNFKTGQQSPWFKNLINFISLFYRKYLQIDIQPVFDYIIMKIGQPVQELQLNQQLPGALLKLLHQILSKMFCNFILKQVNKNKLQMLCAGPKLQLQAMDISEQIKASKKSKVILQKFFWGKSVDQYDGQSLAISLLVLLTQKRAQLLHKSYISNLKIIGDIYDDYTVIIIQLIRVLNQLSSGYTQYAKLLPENSLNLLVNQYKLPMEIAFQIYRPSIKHISSMPGEEWTKFVGEVGQVINKFISSDQKYINRYDDNQKLKNYLNENYSKINNVMSHQFFVTFWMLTLDSIYFPQKLYNDKIQQVKKKAQVKLNRTKNDKSDREIEKARNLYMNLRAQDSQQQKKVQDTLNEQNSSRLKVEFLKNAPKDEKNSSLPIQQFAQIFVQICLLPRMMLDPEEALYCMKITLQVIKINKLSSGKSIKLLLYIIEHVMNYLPYSSERQASYCLSIFLSEMLSLTTNWNDSTKLKQDMKKFLGIDENFVEESYPRIKKQFIKLYIRFGNIIKSIKDEPYSIRNCLYLLEKVDAIPAYKKQAEQLQTYLKQLKQKFASILPTILEMQLSIMAAKKKTLPVIQQQGPILQFRPQFLGAYPPAFNADVKMPNVSPLRGRNDRQEKFSMNPNQYKTPQIQEKKDSKKDSKELKQEEKQKVVDNNKQFEKNQNFHKQKTPIHSQQTQKIEKQSNPNAMQDEKIQTGSKQNGQKQIPKVLDRKQQKNTSINTPSTNVVGPPSSLAPFVAPVNVSTLALTAPAQVQAQAPSNLPPIQTVAQRKAAAELEREKEKQKEREKQKQRQNLQKQKQNLNQPKPEVSSVPTVQVPTAPRIKTVAQMRQQASRKATQAINAQQPQLVPNQPQINEKLIKQIKKDQIPRSQIAQWPKQEQKSDRPKTPQSLNQPNQPSQSSQSSQPSQTSQPNQTTVQFRKNSIQDKRNPMDPITNWGSKPERIQPIQKQKDLKQVNIQILPSKINKMDQSTVEIVNPPIKQQIQPERERQKQQQHHHSHSHSRSKDKIQQAFKGKDNKIEWMKIDKQDRYSQDKNQGRQRQYKRESRPYDKDKQDRIDRERQDRERDRIDRDRQDREKQQKRDNKTQSRWKQRQDYRDKTNQDRHNERHKDSKDRNNNKRKQDKYDRDRDRDRKHDHKGRQRSRERQRSRDYRK